ncbi:hypothetical protein EHT87_14365 [Larkinella knui]|uniref:Uncharacterized protein n=1 Tax=Larkinella knui TaxID=2025310 RepID=A0A3P1CK73_9BACT|nr:hypothetical protein EHT87_14365 [Larkinella knui]
MIPDDRNANVGTEYGGHLLQKSLQKLGAGRSILLDKNNRVIAGNKTLETAAALGLENVQIVESDGKTIIAVKRTDLDLDSKRGREMALADNKVSQVNLSFDADVVDDIAADFDVDLNEWGFDSIEPEEKKISLPSGEKEFKQMTFILTDDQAKRVESAIKLVKKTNDFDGTGNENSNGNALAFIVDQYLAKLNG